VPVSGSGGRFASIGAAPLGEAELRAAAARLGALLPPALREEAEALWHPGEGSGSGGAGGGVRAAALPRLPPAIASTLALLAETAARVAAGGVAKALLSALGIEIWSFTPEVGGVAVDPANCTRTRDEADVSPLRCPDPAAEERMVARIDEAREAGNTVGGIFEVVVKGLPMGLGSYVHWDRRLDTALAGAIASIQSVKGVEFGLGFEQTRIFGSEVHDVIEGRSADGSWVHRTNRAGGLTGGVSNGEPIVVRGAVKPISTLARPLPSADLITGEKVEKAHYERSDISVVPAAGVIGEAMVALAIVPFLLEKTGGDSLAEIQANLAALRARSAAPRTAPSAGGTSAGSGGDD
jgi:chorismate synthase